MGKKERRKMIKTIALGSIYLLMLFAFAAGIESLAKGDCSDWLVTCSVENVALRPADDGVPDTSELR